jgi:hypothetical protein
MSDETGKSTLVSSCEEINSGFKRIYEGIHLIFCIVEVKTCTSTWSDTKGPMQNLCTVMPWPNCYAVLKQKGQQISTELPVLMKILFHGSKQKHHTNK